LGAVVIALLAPAAMAQSITLRANHQPGDVVSIDQTITVSMNMTGPNNMQMNMNMNGRQTGSFEVVEAQDGEPTVAKVNFDKGGVMSMDMGPMGKQEQPMPLAGKSYTLKKGAGGTVTADPPANAEEMTGLTALMQTNTGILPGKAVNVGETWNVDASKMMGGLGMEKGSEVSGTAKLDEVKSVGGRQIAVISVDIKGSAMTPDGMAMNIRLTGPMEVDAATGRAVAGNVSGPITMPANQQGMAMDGKMGMILKGAVSGKGGAPAPVAGGGNVPVIGGGMVGGGVAAANWSGEFKGDALTINITGTAPNLNGTLTMGTNKFDFEGKADGSKLTGKFNAGGTSYDFTANLDGDTLTLKTGDTTYTTKRAATARNPLER
jgi:hypothetical protein